MVQQRLRSSIFNSLIFLAMLIALSPALSLAGGFGLLEQSAQGLGVGFAGATAGYDDGSAIFFNPGAMSSLDKTTLSAGVSMVSPNAEFSNDGSRDAIGQPLSGGNGPDGGVVGWLPTLYAAHPLCNGVTLGFGVNAPFGLSTNYSDDWVGRYSADNSELMSVTMSPAISYDVTDSFAVGAAVNVMYAHAKLTNAIDFCTIGAAKLGLPTAASLGLLPQQADGSGKIVGDDWGVGATVGVQFKYGEGSRVGLSYRSQIDTTLRGDAEFTVPENARVLTSTGAFVDTDAKANLTVPDSIQLGWIHNFDEEWSLLAETQWTHWSHFSELRVNYDSVQPDTVVDESWENVWRYSIGTEYRPLKDLRLRAGFTYDAEPIPNKYHRTPRIPGNDRYWMSFGASYNFTEELRLDAGYAHLFVPSAKTEVSSSTGDVLRGDWDLSVDVASLQLVYVF